MSRTKWRAQLPLHIMLIPAIVLLAIYSYGPMFGIVMAFQDFRPELGIFGSKWVGLDNFEYLFMLPNIFQVWWNTLFIATLKIVFGIIVPVIVALQLNEVRQNKIRRTIQTLVYLPHFLSWVILSGVLLDILSPNTGIVNAFLSSLGMKPIFFLGDQSIFPYTIVASSVWKDFGFGTIIYLAALSNVDPTMYESARIDGANRWQQTIFITLPSITPIIILMTVLSLGNVLNAGFDQIFNLYSPQVYRTGDIIDTLTYRIGLIQLQYSLSTAVGLLKSAVSCILIITSYKLADRFAGYKVF